MSLARPPLARPPFDSNRAWQQATAAIRANREVVFTLAGVFFLLPALALSLLFPQPEAVAGANEAAIMAQAAEYYRQALPVALPMAALQAMGTLGLLTLLTDRARPTVGQAIRAGFGALFPYLASQIILGMAVGMLLLLVGGVIGAVGSPVLTVAGSIALAFAGAVILTRFALTAPVVAIDGWRNPLAALRRAWQLTAGNTMRVLVFFALILLACAIVMSVAMGLSGIVLALVLPAKIAAIVAAVMSATLGAGMALLLVASLAATHAQLAGTVPESVGSAFE